MRYITDIGLTSRFFQAYHAYHTVYHIVALSLLGPVKTIAKRFIEKVSYIKVA